MRRRTLLALALSVIVSLATRSAGDRDRIRTEGTDYATSPAFNVASLAVVAILVALYATFW